jgi:hypothetical protein
MKTTNKLSKWCKITLMLPIVAVVLTVVSCQKDDLFSDAASDALFRATPLSVRAAAGTPIVVDFEDAQDYLAGPTSYGENLYDGYQDQYFGYYDEATELFMMINETGKWSTAPNFFNGGIAISQWNNTVMPGDSNQCSVHYIDPNTGYGGHNGSNTFAVHFGYYDTISPPAYSMGDTRSYITFDDPDKTCVFNHFYVNNSTYAFLAMKDGYFVASPLEPVNGWFKLVIEGIKSDGTSAGKVEQYLADFRPNAVSPGIIEDWTYVDLSSLGSVTAIRFDMVGSDVGTYGLNTPAYFCFDDLSVTLDQ